MSRNYETYPELFPDTLRDDSYREERLSDAWKARAFKTSQVWIVCTECGLESVGRCKGCGNVPLCENCGPMCSDCLEGKDDQRYD